MKTTFILVVDDFGIKNLPIKDGQYLKQALETKYTVMVDYLGSLCIGVSLNLDYDKQQVTCSIPRYIPKLPQRLKHIALSIL